MEERVERLEAAINLTTKILEQHQKQLKHLLDEMEAMVKLYGGKHNDNNEKFL